MKRVRMLLRVSSSQQLEADGDLSIQRAILKEYIARQQGWLLDEKEYFEGSISAYKNTAEERDVLQEILADARDNAFDILVPYKDDRVGRLMLDTTLYIVELKKYHVDVYSVKDGCISPKSADDIEGMMMLVFRYANAQKSSKDTGLRVKDTAQKLVQKGKFMGGCAPFGYALEYSGEISKHGRALKHLVILPEQAEAVKEIYRLSLTREFGSAKIAQQMNKNEYYKHLAPNGTWKSSAITSILTNPIYAGHTAYKRRERVNGSYHRLDSKDWVISQEPNEAITIIDRDTWDRVQEQRRQRGEKFQGKPARPKLNVIGCNDGILPLAGLLYCGYCGSKMVNGSKYSYWTLKSTGERKARKIPFYKCPCAGRDVSHEQPCLYRADLTDSVLLEALSQYVSRLLEKEDIQAQINACRDAEKKTLEKTAQREQQELWKLKKEIEVLENHIPNAMTGNYPLSLEELTLLINRRKKQLEKQEEIILQKEALLKRADTFPLPGQEPDSALPTWQRVFQNTDIHTKRVLAMKLIDQIHIKKGELLVRFTVHPG
ncbi:hypothetical protein IMSAGC019_03912 [Lachnospiraceae bacterium]|nr:hypothetical protein IMSAGC019_03912 [Lachnospiraceae bacterium]